VTSKLILGLDPGKNTGWSIIKVENKIISIEDFGVEKNGDVSYIAAQCIPDVDQVVVEDFKLRPVKARAGVFDYSDMIAPKVIGKIELLCEMAKKDLAKQQPSVKPSAYGFANMVYVRGKKNQHWQDAYVHAVYFAVTRWNALPVKKLSKSN
jgi:hypothetical protein